MRWVYKGMLTLLLILLFDGQAVSDTSLAALVRTIQPAVVTIVTYDKNNKPLRQGTGFFVSSKGHLISNLHVLKDANSAEIKTYDGRSYPIKTVLGENAAVDLIKVGVDVPQTSVRWLKVIEAAPEVAERIIVVGSPMGLEQTVSEGILSALREGPGGEKIYQISAPISQGSSGSPVINTKGEVIGVATFYIMKGQNLNFAIPGRYVLGLKEDSPGRALSELSRSDYKTEELYNKGLEIAKEGFYMEEGYRNAFPFFKEVTERDPGHAEGWFQLGRAYFKLNRYRESLTALREAIRLKPDFVEALNEIGSVYSEIGLHDSALEAFKKAASIDPDNYNSFYGLAYTYEKLGAPLRMSIDAYKQCVRIAPDDAIVHYYLGDMYRAIGDKAAATNEYRILVDIANRGKYEHDKKLAQHLANKLLKEINK